MWSLYKKKEDDYSNSGDIFSYSGDKLEPLKFSNGKTQEDIVNEILESINKGEKIIFVRGVCGSGKSAIALNLAKHFKKTSVVVPIKSLQDQYEKDYTDKNFILKEDGKRLKISVIKGRGNFPCLFSHGKKADDTLLPCDIELREKNMQKILDYIALNKDVKKEDFSTVSDVRRISIAAACPYWSPLLPVDAGGKTLSKAKKKKYMTISGKEYALFQRAKGCGYYDQFNAYIDADVLIFNAQKYLLETAIGRKPKTDLDIIDECDDFLDSFANEKKINLNRLISALSNLVPEKSEDKNVIKDLILTTNRVIAHYKEGVEKLEVHAFKELFEKILENPYLAEEEDNNYYNSVFEAVKTFDGLSDETYISYEKSEGEQSGLFGRNYGDTFYINLVSINVSKRFKDLIKMNNVFVLMSGTLHSDEVLKDIFGLDKFKIIEAETESPGKITKFRTGYEINCKYEIMKNLKDGRERYLKALSACVANAKSPTLVHVSSFGDLPNQFEKEKYGVDNLMTREELVRNQDASSVKEFKSGKKNILFTTKCSRGVDFPGEECNSIIITKYPYPNIQDLFWQILRKEQPEKFMEFYLDKSKRDLIQKIARGVRFKGDQVLLLSPDSRVFDARLE